MESAVYSPLPLPFLADLRPDFSFAALVDLLFSVTVEVADGESFAGILLHSIGNTNRASIAVLAGGIALLNPLSLTTRIYLKFQWLNSLRSSFILPQEAVT